MALLKNILILVVILAILYAGYRFFFAGNESSLIVESSANEGQLLASEFLMRLNEIQGVSFSRELFDDPRFRSLVSFSSTPDTVSAGRPNPFSR